MIQAESIIQWLEEPQLLSEEERYMVDALLKKHPYFVPGHYLKAFLDNKISGKRQVVASTMVLYRGNWTFYENKLQKAITGNDLWKAKAMPVPESSSLFAARKIAQPEAVKDVRLVDIVPEEAAYIEDEQADRVDAPEDNAAVWIEEVTVLRVAKNANEDTAPDAIVPEPTTIDAPEAYEPIWNDADGLTEEILKEHDIEQGVPAVEDVLPVATISEQAATITSVAELPVAAIEENEEDTTAKTDVTEDVAPVETTVAELSEAVAHHAELMPVIMPETAADVAEEPAKEDNIIEEQGEKENATTDNAEAVQDAQAGVTVADDEVVNTPVTEVADNNIPEAEVAVDETYAETATYTEAALADAVLADVPAVEVMAADAESVVADEGNITEEQYLPEAEPITNGTSAGGDVPNELTESDVSDLIEDIDNQVNGPTLDSGDNEEIHHVDEVISAPTDAVGDVPSAIPAELVVTEKPVVTEVPEEIDEPALMITPAEITGKEETVEAEEIIMPAADKYGIEQDKITEDFIADYANASPTATDPVEQKASPADYFLQQGIAVDDELPVAEEITTTKKDKSLLVMMSYSEWLNFFQKKTVEAKEEEEDKKALKSMWQREKLAEALGEEEDEIPENVFEMAVNSLAKEEGLVSESLAEIFIKQGKHDRALEMFQKLKLRNPQKSTYFAARIAEIQKDIES